MVLGWLQENAYQLNADQGIVQDPTGSNTPVRVLREVAGVILSRFVRVSNRIFVSAESVRRIWFSISQNSLIVYTARNRNYSVLALGILLII